MTGADEVTVPVCAQCVHTRSRFLRTILDYQLELADSDGERPRREGRLVC